VQREIKELAHQIPRLAIFFHWIQIRCW